MYLIYLLYSYWIKQFINPLIILFIVQSDFCSILVIF